MASVENAEKTFAVPAWKMAEIEAWKAEHNKKCDLPEWYPMFTPTCKYAYMFRETGIGNGPKIKCDCGAEFYSDTGDENL